MCNKVAYNFLHALELVPECYKSQKMCDKAVNTYPSTIKFVPECLIIKVVNRCFLHLILDLII